jgi:hypothetical protein
MGRIASEFEADQGASQESFSEPFGAMTKRTKIRGMGRLWRMVIVLAVCFGASLALKIWLDQRLTMVSSPASSAGPSSVPGSVQLP